MKIVPGSIYGKTRVIRLISEDRDKKYCIWECQCENCGKIFQMRQYNILQKDNAGCPDCRKKRKSVLMSQKPKKWGKLAAEHIGEFHGYLEIIGISPNRNKNAIVGICKCHKCGSITNIILSRVLAGVVTQCVECSRKNLDTGRTIAKEVIKEGTNPIQLGNVRALNKNNTSGHKGVCWYKRGNCWRAYIVFKRKQYSLGLYKNIEDAVAAREEAERQIYGNFLEYYKEKYPLEWTRVAEIRERKKQEQA